jgi:probable addiction module antidote protein
MPKRTRDYHAFLVKRLADPKAAEGYLNAAINDSSEMFLKALRNVAEARRMSRVAKEAGVSRESLYRTLSGEGNPRFDTLTSVLSVLGLRLKLEVFPETAPAVTFGGSELSSTPFPPYQASNPKADVKSLLARYLLSDQYLRMASTYVVSNSEMQWLERMEHTPLSTAAKMTYIPGAASGVTLTPVKPASPEPQTHVIDPANQQIMGSRRPAFSQAAA